MIFGHSDIVVIVITVTITPRYTSRGLKCGENCDFSLSPLPRERITKNASDESGGEGQGEGV
jgi:hypothetical protein